MRSVIPLFLLLAACSGGTVKQSSLPSVAPTTEAPSPTENPTESPTESPSASPTPTPSPSASATPSPTKKAAPVDGDVDGDGKADLIQPSATQLKITLTSNGKVLTSAVHEDDPGTPAILGTGDIDRDGRQEVFLETAMGASTSFATPYRYDGTTLKELQLDGGPARLGIGGSITHGDGFRCLTSGLLEIRQAQSDDGTTFHVQASDYKISGDQLVLVKTMTGTAKQGEPPVESSYSADCGFVGD